MITGKNRFCYFFFISLLKSLTLIHCLNDYMLVNWEDFYTVLNKNYHKVTEKAQHKTIFQMCLLPFKGIDYIPRLRAHKLNTRHLQYILRHFDMWLLHHLPSRWKQRCSGGALNHVIRGVLCDFVGQQNNTKCLLLSRDHRSFDVFIILAKNCPCR